jgi:nucleotide-binding universal stress UspA family protein
VYWPPEQYERLKIKGPIPIGKGHPEVEAAIERELRSRLTSLGAAGEIELRMIGGLGRVADHLAQIADEEKADLIAVGAEQRGGLARFWHGSVSHGVIHSAAVSVACVPIRPSTPA